MGTSYFGTSPQPKSLYPGSFILYPGEEIGDNPQTTLFSWMVKADMKPRKVSRLVDETNQQGDRNDSGSSDPVLPTVCYVSQPILLLWNKLELGFCHLQLLRVLIKTSFLSCDKLRTTLSKISKEVSSKSS